MSDITPKTISQAEAHRLMQDPAVIVLDVSSREEFDALHIPGAIHVAHTDIEARADEMLPKDAQILVYCRVGRRSLLAVSTLLRLGYANAVNFGGIDIWHYAKAGTQA